MNYILTITWLDLVFLSSVPIAIIIYCLSVVMRIDNDDKKHPPCQKSLKEEQDELEGYLSTV